MESTEHEMALGIVEGQWGCREKWGRMKVRAWGWQRDMGHVEEREDFRVVEVALGEAEGQWGMAGGRRDAWRMR